MKRAFVEISDEEWENHSFKPARVLKNPPPSIESFAYRPAANQSNSNSNHGAENSIGVAENLEDDDVDELREVRPQAAGRGRRFVVDEDSEDDFAEVIEVKSTEDERSELSFGEEEEEEEVEEGDVVGKALQKCAKISSELRRELYGSSVEACDRYAEVEASSVRIVTQEDIFMACGAEDSDFQPILKPYQLVGVNFLLLLYRKRIGGGTFTGLSQITCTILAC